MPAYIVLSKFTQQQLTTLTSTPERLKQAKVRVEAAGGRVIGVWLTMGEYDMVGIFEWPDDQSAAAFALAQEARGNVRTHTLKAFSEEEFAQIVGKLP